MSECVRVCTIPDNYYILCIKTLKYETYREKSGKGNKNIPFYKPDLFESGLIFAIKIKFY
jgi:hypothetical protein